jgi:hypothetical protein
LITFQELATFTSSRDWTLTGRARQSGHHRGRIEPRITWLRNRICHPGKFLRGLNAHEIEARLGLRPNSTKRGFYVMYFARLPKLAEVEQRFSADMPDGKVWTDSMHSDFEKSRAEAQQSGSDRVDFFLPVPAGSSNGN